MQWDSCFLKFLVYSFLKAKWKDKEVSLFLIICKSILFPPFKKFRKNLLPNATGVEMLAADQIENLPPIDLSNVIMLEGRMLFLIALL